MRWRLVDRIEGWDAWGSIRAVKCISLEEGHLLERLGRRGVWPESLALGSLVELARWLIIASSDFNESGVLREVEGFTLADQVGLGASLSLTATVLERHPAQLRLGASCHSGGALVGTGTLKLGLTALGELIRPDHARRLWQEIHGTAA